MANLGKNDKARFVRAAGKSESDPPLAPQLRQQQAIRARLGTLDGAWSTSTRNQVTLDLSDGDGGSLGDTQQITAYVLLPTDSEPPFVGLADGDLVAFLPFFETVGSTPTMRGVLINPPLIPEIPDTAKDYMLVYDSTDGVKWIETSTTCPTA